MTDRLTKTIISLAKFNNLIRDRFFYDKFSNKLQNLLANYILLLNRSGFTSPKPSEGGDNVAQYQVSHEKVLENIKDILEMTEDLRYLNLVRLSPLFLHIQKNLLTLKLELMKSRNKPPEFKMEDVQENPFKKETDKKVAPVNVAKKNLKLNQSKKKILEFIKSYPNIRTKDIISEFNALSDRTVKRNLTDLLRTGFIKKKVDNKAVYYYSSEVEVRPQI